MPTASALEAQLLALPEAARLRLVGVLLRSLDPEPADPIAQAAWWGEVQRRIRAPAEGSASLQAMRERLGYPPKSPGRMPHARCLLHERPPEPWVLRTVEPKGLRF